MHLRDRTTMPIHPRTGLAAVGIVRGKPVWPILGGDGTGDGGDAAAQAAAKAAADAQAAADKAAADAANYTPPASQADLDRIVQERLSRQTKQYGMTPEEVKALKDRTDKLEYDLGTDKDKAVADARNEERTKLLSEATPRVVRAEFKAAAKGVLTDDQLKALIEDLDMSKYVDANGDPDEDKIANKVAAFAPAGNGNGNNSKTPPPRLLGQGNQRVAAAQPGEQARAQLEKRFPTKK